MGNNGVDMFKYKIGQMLDTGDHGVGKLVAVQVYNPDEMRLVYDQSVEEYFTPVQDYTLEGEPIIPDQKHLMWHRFIIKIDPQNMDPRMRDYWAKSNNELAFFRAEIERYNP